MCSSIIVAGGNVLLSNSVANAGGYSMWLIDVVIIQYSECVWYLVLVFIDIVWLTVFSIVSRTMYSVIH